MRLMDLAERARMPVLTFIDTPGAYPGLEAEQRGQSQAIAESIHSMFSLTVPVLSVVIGEGGSGGALAIGIANRMLMQEYSTYSVISPESCASILWSDSSLAESASEKLKMSPSELLKLGVIDAIIPEPKGGAHRDWTLACRLMREALLAQFAPAIAESLSFEAGSKDAKRVGKKLNQERLRKFRSMGEGALAHAPGTG